MKATVAHVEAGMRSHSLRHPFPEEANRRLAGLLVDIHFAPSEREVANLAGRRGVVVNTGANTAIDALRFALGDVQVQAGDYGVATLHRFELLHDSARLRQTVEWLVRGVPGPGDPLLRRGVGPGGADPSRAAWTCSTTTCSSWRSCRTSSSPRKWQVLRSS